jgi:glutamate dehydrogenase/leucine dehydrogenase
MLFGYPEAEAISNQDLLESRCDVLILAAAARQLNAQNANRVQAAIVLEGVERPTTRAAEKILEERGGLVIPDILGTGGGLLSSFLEWAQNVRYRYLSPAEVEEHLKVRLENAYDQTVSTSTHHGTNLRHGAHLLAIGRVVAALRLQ